MQKPAYILVAACLCLLLVLLGAATRSGFVPSSGSTAIWRLPFSDAVGCFRSDGAGNVTLVTCSTGGTGDVTSNTSTSVVNEIALFADTSGKRLKRSVGTGIVTLASGQLGTRTAPGGTIIGDTDTQTLTNKTVVRRSVTYTDAATVTINADTTDLAVLLTLSQTTTFANPTTGSGIPNAQPLIIRIKSATARVLAWGSQFRGTAAAPLPTTTSGGSLTDYYGFIRNSTDSRWDYMPMNLGF